MSRLPSKRAFDAMTLDELVSGLRPPEGVDPKRWPSVRPYIRALMRRDPVEVGRCAIELIQLGLEDLHVASFVFEASGGARSPAKEEALPILKPLLRRKATQPGAIACLGKLAQFSQIRGHRRFLGPKFDYATRWAATMALSDCMMWPLDPTTPDLRAIEGLIIVAKMRADDSTDFGAAFYLATANQRHKTPLIDAFLDEVRSGPANELQKRVNGYLSDD